jgi:hypothetical protein
MLKKPWMVILLALLVVGCEKGDGNCGSPPPVPLISWDEPVVEGQPLVIQARGDNEDEYKWIGPGNYQGEGRVLEFDAIQVAQSGTYTVQLKQGDCSPIFNSAYLEVEPLPLPCNPSANTLTIGQGVKRSFDEIHCELPASAVYYTIRSTINGSGADKINLAIRLGHSFPPTFNRSYAVSSSSLNQNEVGAELERNDTLYHASSGRVYVRVTVDGFTAHFCDLLFRASLNESVLLTASATIACPN